MNIFEQILQTAAAVDAENEQRLMLLRDKRLEQLKKESMNFDQLFSRHSGWIDIRELIDLDKLKQQLELYGPYKFAAQYRLPERTITGYLTRSPKRMSEHNAKVFIRVFGADILKSKD
jgi:hypothetical protein